MAKRQKDKFEDVDTKDFGPLFSLATNNEPVDDAEQTEASLANDGTADRPEGKVWGKGSIAHPSEEDVALTAAPIDHAAATNSVDDSVDLAGEQESAASEEALTTYAMEEDTALADDADSRADDGLVVNMKPRDHEAEPAAEMVVQVTSDLSYLPVDTRTRRQIQNHTVEIQQRLRLVQENILDIGRCLREVKRKLPHGSFGGWLRREFEWSRDTAENFMNVAKLIDLDPKFSVYYNCFTRSALYLFAQESTSTTARDEALAHVASGGSFSIREVKNLIARCTPKQTNVQDAATDETFIEADVVENLDDAFSQEARCETNMVPALRAPNLVEADNEAVSDDDFAEFDGDEQRAASLTLRQRADTASISATATHLVLDDLLSHGAREDEPGLLLLALALSFDEQLSQVLDADAEQLKSLLHQRVLARLNTLPGIVLHNLNYALNQYFNDPTAQTAETPASLQS